MKTRKISPMIKENEGAPTVDTTTQFRWLPIGSVGNTDGEQARVEWKRPVWNL